MKTLSCRKKTRRRGMTMLEMAVATSILSVLMLVAMSSFVDIVRAVNLQDTITRMDQRANRTMREIADLLKPAILPVYVERTSADYENTEDIFYDIDNRTWGFGASMGKRWLSRLQAGMDAIAFNVPIDAQGVGDFLDDANHLQIGQLRGDISYLAAAATGTPNSGNNFKIRSGTSPVSALAVMDPDRLTDPSFESIDAPSLADWSGTANSSWPSVTAFTAIRFVPVYRNGTPLILTEANFLNGSIDIDLDGDGSVDGQFQVGHLQLVYSGGTNFYHIENDSIRQGAVSQEVVRLTPNVVLRRVNTAQRTPIFRLVNYSLGNISTDSGSLGQVFESSTGGTQALSIKLLLLDNDGFTDEGRPLTKQYLNSLTARWYETTVSLKNMKR